MWESVSDAAGIEGLKFDWFVGDRVLLVLLVLFVLRG